MYKELMKYKIKKPKNLSPILSMQLGREIIDIIINRTLAGRDINNDSFVGYSKTYRESEEFEDWRKSATQVNLRLTGDMQESLFVENTFGTHVTIGFREELEAAKAHGHNNGSRILPKREWFGLSKEEEKKLLQKYEALQKALDNTSLDNVLKSQKNNGDEGINVFDIDTFVEGNNNV